VVTRARHRRLSRLERLAAPVIKRVKQADEAADQAIHAAALVHATNLAALVAHGDPKIGEPLSDAWLRCTGSNIWRDWQANLPPALFPPFDSVSSDLIFKYLSAHWLSTLPGDSNLKKLDGILSIAPPWLVWFTFADFTANFLKIGLPDLSGVRAFDRSIKVFEGWPVLPQGKFELQPRKRTPYDDLDISNEDCEFVIEMKGVPEERMTRFQRKRYASILEKLPPIELRPERTK
jgi:hypothetical protein